MKTLLLLLGLFVVLTLTQDVDNASFDSEDRPRSRLQGDAPSTVESPTKPDEKLPQANRTRPANRTDVSETERVGPTFKAKEHRKLSWITNRTDESIRVYPTVGVGRSNLWFNVSEVYLIYRNRFPWVSSEKAGERDKDDQSIRDQASNTTRNATTFQADDETGKDYHERARDNIERFESRLKDLKAVVVQRSGLQFFPVFHSTPTFRGHMKQRRQRPATTPQRMFVHPELMKEARNQMPKFFETLRSQSDQPLLEHESNFEMPKFDKIEHEEAFATYRILIGLDSFTDLVEDLNKYNMSMRAIRLVADKQSELAAKKEATSLAVAEAMNRADGVFDSLGLEYKGLFDFRVLDSRIPRLPLLPIERNQVPAIRPIQLPLMSRVLLYLAY